MIVTDAPTGQRVTMIYTHACCPVGAKGQRVTMIPWKRNAQGKSYYVHWFSTKEGTMAAENLLRTLRDTISSSFLVSLIEDFKGARKGYVQKPTHVVSLLCEYRNKRLLKKYQEEKAHSLHTSFVPSKGFFVLRIQTEASKGQKKYANLFVCLPLQKRTHRRDTNCLLKSPIRDTPCKGYQPSKNQRIEEVLKSKNLTLFLCFKKLSSS